VAAALLTATFSMATANAQQSPKKGGIKLGPFQVSAVAPFAAGVDSNVYNTPEGVSDETFTIAPTLQVLLPLGRRARIRSTGGVAPYYFNTERSQRHTDVFGTTRAEIDVGPVTAFGGLEASRYRQRFTLEIDDRIRRDTSGTLFGATFRIGHSSTLTASQHFVKSTFDPDAQFAGQPVSVALDRETTTRTLQLTFPLTRKTSLAPWFELIEDDFIGAAPGQIPIVKSSRFGLGFEFSELAFFNGRAAGGIRHYPGDGVVPPYTGPFIAVNLGMPFILGSRLQLNGARDVTYSATPSAAGPAARQTYVTGTYGATVTFELPWRLQGRLLVGYDTTEYLALDGQDPATVPPGEHGKTVGGAVLRHLGRHLSLGGIARLVDRSSPLPTRSYQDNQYGITGDIRF